MPSILSTFRYGFIKYIQPKRVLIKHVLVRILLFVLVAAFIEAAVFNFRSITTMFNEPIDVSDQINLAQTEDGRYVASATQNTIELKNIDKKVNSVHLKLDKNQDAQEFSVLINFTDSAHSTYFNTTEYTVGVPEYKMSTVSKRSHYFVLQSTGNLKDLQLKIAGEKVNYPIYIKGLVLNDKYPFQFLY